MTWKHTILQAIINAVMPSGRWVLTSWPLFTSSSTTSSRPAQTTQSNSSLVILCTLPDQTMTYTILHYNDYRSSVSSNEQFLDLRSKIPWKTFFWFLLIDKLAKQQTNWGKAQCFSQRQHVAAMLQDLQSKSTSLVCNICQETC